MQAMVLAAGMGRRMGKYTQDCTKCMMSVGGKLLIERIAESLKQSGITRLIMVVGYEKEKLEAFFESYDSELEVKFIYNNDYAATNNIYSLFLAKDELMKDDTILMESDLIFDYEIIEKIVRDPDENMVTVAKYEQWMDGTVVLLDEDKNILDFVEKNDFSFDKANDYYKTVNIYKFSKDFSRNQYVPFLEAYIKAYGVNQYYELVLKILAHVRFSQMRAFLVEDYNWYEIDDVQDLRIAETIFAADDKQFQAYDHQYGGFWRFPKLKDFCYLVNPHYPPQKMLDHMKYFYETLLREYPSGLQTQNLNAGRMFDIDDEYIIVGNGAAEIINTLGSLMTGILLFPVPVFNEYSRCFTNSNKKAINSQDYDFNLNADIFIDNLDDVNQVAIVNPDNPSGNFIPYDDMIRILEVCKERGITCIVDESFVDFAEAKIRYTLIQQNILEQYPNLVVIKSISKSYGVPGLRLGVLASSDTTLLHNIKMKMPIWNINSFAEYFLQIQSLYKSDYSKACDKIAEQRIYMEKRLAELKFIKPYHSQANYIMCQLTGSMTAKELANILVKHYNILIKDLTNKDGVTNAQYIRLAVKEKHDNDLILNAIKKVLQ